MVVDEVLTFSSGLPSEMCVQVLVDEDNLVEADETFQLVLFSDDPAVLLVEPNTTEVTIINTDGK